MIITNELENIAREVWIEASKFLKFELITPYTFKINEKELTVFAYLPKYGNKSGTIVCLTSPPNYETSPAILKEWAKNNYYHLSCINIEYCMIYNETYFIEVLGDWGLS